MHEQTRSFRIYNSKGKMIDLLANLDFFGVSPEGLGISFDNDYKRTSTNFIPTSTNLNMNEFKINIVFGAISNDPYRRYSEFIDLLNHPPYTLEYITDVGKYQRKCLLNEMTKGEIGPFNVIMEEFTLDLITPWYKTVENSTVIQPSQSNDGKIYEGHSGDLGEKDALWLYSYPKDGDYVYGEHKELPTFKEFYYEYDYIYEGWKDGADGTFVIDNESVYLGSDDSSPAEVTIYGPAENPTWEVLKDSKIFASDGFNLILREGYKLVVSSIPNEQKAILIGPDGKERNVYQQQMLDKSNFIRIPLGTSNIVFSGCKKVKFTYNEERVVV